MIYGKNIISLAVDYCPLILVAPKIVFCGIYSKGQINLDELKLLYSQSQIQIRHMYCILKLGERTLIVQTYLLPLHNMQLCQKSTASRRPTRVE